MRLAVNRSTVLLLLLGGLLASGVFLLFTNEAASQLDSVRTDVDAAKEQVDTLERRLAGEEPDPGPDDSGELDGAALRQRAEALDAALPDNLDTLDFEAQLPDLIDARGGEVSSLSRGEASSEGNVQYRPLSLSAQLPPESLTDVLGDLRQQTRLTTVHDLSVSGFGSDEMSVSMELRLWAATDAAAGDRSPGGNDDESAVPPGPEPEAPPDAEDGVERPGDLDAELEDRTAP